MGKMAALYFDAYQGAIHRVKPKTKKLVPYLGLYNVQDFAQILYFVGGVRIINRNNVFHSFPDWEITFLPSAFGSTQNHYPESESTSLCSHSAIQGAQLRSSKYHI
jgi:hypothetical protein